MNDEPPHGPQPGIVYLTAPELARRLGVCHESVRKAAQKGRLAGAYKEQTPRGDVWRIPVAYTQPAAFRAAAGRPGRPRKA